MMKKWFARFGDESSDNVATVYDIHPDLAEAFIDAIRNRVNVQPPRHAANGDQLSGYNQLTSLIAQTSRVIKHLEEFRELAIVEADKTHELADRKGIAIAAGFPPSRLYRVLERHGRRKDRRAEVLPDLGRLEQHLTSIRAQAADASLTSEQREKLEQAIPKIEAQIAEVRATTAARADEK